MALPNDYRALAADIVSRCRPAPHEEPLRDLIMEASVLIDKAARAPTGHGGGPLLAALTMLCQHECDVYEFGDRLIAASPDAELHTSILWMERRFAAALATAITQADAPAGRLEAVREALAELEHILDTAAERAA